MATGTLHHWLGGRVLDDRTDDFVSVTHHLAAISFGSHPQIAQKRGSLYITLLGICGGEREAALLDDWKYLQQLPEREKS